MSAGHDKPSCGERSACGHEPAQKAERPSSAFISLDDDSAPGSTEAEGKGRGDRPRSPQRRYAVAGAFAVCCVALIIGCLGFIHPAKDGSWSIGWLLQTTVQESSPGASDSLTAKKAEAEAAASDDTDSEAADAADGSASNSEVLAGQRDTDASNAADGDCGSDDDTSSSGNTGGNADGSGSGSSAGGTSNGGLQNSKIKITVSVSSSQVPGNPVSGGGTFTFESGATAYDALCALGFTVNAADSQFGIYVSAIGGLAEKEYGATSGWLYHVNGSQPNISSSRYTLKDGDHVEWVYSVSE